MRLMYSVFPCGRVVCRSLDKSVCAHMFINILLRSLLEHIIALNQIEMLTKLMFGSCLKQF